MVLPTCAVPCAGRTDTSSAGSASACARAYSCEQRLWFAGRNQQVLGTGLGSHRFPPSDAQAEPPPCTACRPHGSVPPAVLGRAAPAAVELVVSAWSSCRFVVVLGLRWSQAGKPRRAGSALLSRTRGARGEAVPSGSSSMSPGRRLCALLAFLAFPVSTLIFPCCHLSPLFPGP